MSIEQADRNAVAELGPWFHNLHLPGGVETAPNHPLGDFPAVKWRQLSPHLPSSMQGWRVLDIGCNAGYYSFELARRGASVTAIDDDERYLAQARWARARLGLEDRVRLCKQQVYSLGNEVGDYDLVLFMGVFYHLRYPLLALDLIAPLVRRLLVFQSLTMPGSEEFEEAPEPTILDRRALASDRWPKMAFIERELESDPTNWWAPNPACMEALLRSAGFLITARPGHEMYLARPKPEGHLGRDLFIDQLRAIRALSRHGGRRR